MTANTDCRDCGRPTGMAAGDYYTAHKAVWAAAGAGNDDHLCLDCFEARLGRPLSEADFVALPHEIMGRFAGEPSAPSPPAERQASLASWRAFVLERPDLFQTEPERRMTTPQRIQLRRVKGYRKPAGAVNVTRTARSYWANPYKIPKGATLEEVIAIVAKFRTDILDSWEKMARLAELRDRDLACYCDLGAPCHADVLIELANR